MNTNGLKLYQGNGAEQTCQLTPQSEIKIALKWAIGGQTAAWFDI
jgi:hypothetical protein